VTNENAEPESTGQRSDRGVFSPRLEAFLEQIEEGATPNAGRFCAFCYNPLPAGFELCDNCGQDLRERPPVNSLPEAVIEMHRRKHRRESLVVNSFAYLGLALGLALFLGMVAINVLYLNRALWFFLLATVVFLVGSRILAGVVGGVVGDEIGYRYANSKLAKDWSEHLAGRETGRRET
jgi:hypothetical protein